jgi:hypothetical protein
LLSDEEYLRKKEVLLSERENIRVKLEAIDKKIPQRFEPSKNAFSSVIKQKNGSYKVEMMKNAYLLIYSCSNLF